MNILSTVFQVNVNHTLFARCVYFFFKEGQKTAKMFNKTHPVLLSKLKYNTRREIIYDMVRVPDLK